MQSKGFFDKVAYFIINFNSFYKKIYSHRYGLTFFAYIASAFFTGFFCVGFIKVFNFLDTHNLTIERIGYWAILISPLLFVLAVNLVRVFAPLASGSGIPQVIFAVSNERDKKSNEMVSFGTMFIKIISIFLGIAAGASLGREGPTVHIAAAFFWLSLRFFSFLIPINLDRSSALIAGGSAGLAAAFNTPLAGVTFAIEEIGGKNFENFKDYVIMAIIISAISAQYLTGDYSYFGRLHFSQQITINDTILISIVCASYGMLFTKLLLKISSYASSLSKTKRYLILPSLIALIILTVDYFWGPDICGPGNKFASSLLNGEIPKNIYFFWLFKFAATILTQISGVAGGIFAPSLSIGASTGSMIALLLDINIKTAALIGMASFLSAVVQAPITSFVIVFEMTGHNEMLLPIMLSSLIGYIISKSLKSKPIYQELSKRY